MRKLVASERRDIRDVENQRSASGTARAAISFISSRFLSQFMLRLARFIALANIATRRPLQ